MTFRGGEEGGQSVLLQENNFRPPRHVNVEPKLAGWLLEAPSNKVSRYSCIGNTQSWVNKMQLAHPFAALLNTGMPSSLSTELLFHLQLLNKVANCASRKVSACAPQKCAFAQVPTLEIHLLAHCDRLSLSRLENDPPWRTKEFASVKHCKSNRFYNVQRKSGLVNS